MCGAHFFFFFFEGSKVLLLVTTDCIYDGKSHNGFIFDALHRNLFLKQSE